MPVIDRHDGPENDRYANSARPVRLRANQAMPAHSAVRSVMAATVRISNGLPARTSRPKTMNAAAVAAAMISARRAAQAFCAASPAAAAT